MPPMAATLLVLAQAGGHDARQIAGLILLVLEADEVRDQRA